MTIEPFYFQDGKSTQYVKIRKDNSESHLRNVLCEIFDEYLVDTSKNGDASVENASSDDIQK